MSLTQLSSRYTSAKPGKATYSDMLVTHPQGRALARSSSSAPCSSAAQPCLLSGRIETDNAGTGLLRQQRRQLPQRGTSIDCRLSKSHRERIYGLGIPEHAVAIHKPGRCVGSPRDQRSHSRGQIGPPAFKWTCDHHCNVRKLHARSSRERSLVSFILGTRRNFLPEREQAPFGIFDGRLVGVSQVSYLSVGGCSVRSNREHRRCSPAFSDHKTMCTSHCSESSSRSA